MRFLLILFITLCIIYPSLIAFVLLFLAVALGIAIVESVLKHLFGIDFTNKDKLL